MCLYPSVSLNNEKNCCEISKDKIAVCEKTAGLRSGNSSACMKALVPVEIFQFSNMHYESRFLDTFRGHNIRPIQPSSIFMKNIHPNPVTFPREISAEYFDISTSHI